MGLGLNLLDSKINVLLNTKAKASSVTEVPSQQLVLLNLQPTFQKLHRLLTSNGDIASNLLITPDSKRSYSVSRYCSQERKNPPTNYSIRSNIVI